MCEAVKVTLAIIMLALAQWFWIHFWFCVLVKIIMVKLKHGIFPATASSNSTNDTAVVKRAINPDVALIEWLLDGYNPDATPLPADGGPVQVTLSYSPGRIVSLVSPYTSPPSLPLKDLPKCTQNLPLLYLTIYNGLGNTGPLRWSWSPMRVFFQRWTIVYSGISLYQWDSPTFWDTIRASKFKIL